MGAPQYEQAGADVAGSGTTNTIPRWTGATTLGDSGLIDNGTVIGVANGTRTLAFNLLQISGNTLTTSTAELALQYATSRDTTVYAPGSSIALIVKGTTGNVGIGTTSPGARLHAVAADGTYQFAVSGTTKGIRFLTTASVAQIDAVDQTLSASYQPLFINGSTVTLANSGSPALTVNTSGNVGIGVTPISPLHVKGNATNTDGILTLTPNTGGRNHQVQSLQASSLFRIFDQSAGASRLEIDINGNISAATTGGTFNASTTSAGIKLPNAPGNTDPNTLDSYREGTRVLAAGDLSGWTYVTATQYWTLVGRTVTLHTIFTGGTSSATGGATIATPPLLTPLRIAAGATVNSAGTALGNGVCVVASTSSTTGTVTTSSAISSSSVDKVITVTYETAGL